MIRVNARLFKAASVCQAREEETTRHYLCGVSIEPHPDGALLAATDGHCLVVILDRGGAAKRKAIVALPGVLQGALVEEADEEDEFGNRARPEDRTLRIDDAGIAVIEGYAASAASCLIADEFPPWRKVFPRAAPTQQPAQAFGARYFARLAEVAGLLCDHEGGAVQIAAMGPEDPALVFFPRFRDAVGVLMPVRDGLTESELTTPAWTGAAAPDAQEPEQ